MLIIICRFSLFFPFYIVFGLDIPNIYKLSRHLITDPANHPYHSPSLSQQKIVRKLRSLMCGKKTFHIHPLRIKTIGWRTHSTLKLYSLTEIVVFFEFIQLSPLDRTIALDRNQCRHKKKILVNKQRIRHGRKLSISDEVFSVGSSFSPPICPIHTHTHSRRDPCSFLFVNTLRKLVFFPPLFTFVSRIS